MRNSYQSAFDRLLESYNSEFTPTTTHEQFLVEQLAASRLRLHRAHALEVFALNQIVTGETDETNPNTRILAHLGTNALAILNRWAAAAEKSYCRAHRELTQARSREKRNEASEAQVWLKQQLLAVPKPPVQNKPNPTPEPQSAPQQRNHLTRRERRRQRAMAAA